MKIYNEVTTRFNDKTGKWETISEDSFEYGGPLELLADMPGNGEMEGGSFSIPTNGTEILSDDTIIDTIKTTAGYFTNGDGTLEATNVYTNSLATSNENYYFNICQEHPVTSSAETQFSVTYGHHAGSGSDAVGDGSDPNNLKTPSEAVYKQFVSLLLAENEQSGGFGWWNNISRC